MANIWEVMDSLLLMTDIQESERKPAMVICEHALKEVMSCLSDTADTSDPRITSAAAARAFYTLCVKRASQSETTNMSGFKAGDLSVSYDTVNPQQQLELAKEILGKAMQALIPLLADNGFFVGKVDI